MRPKIVIGVLLLACCLWVIIAIGSKGLRSASSSPNASNAQPQETSSFQPLLGPSDSTTTNIVVGEANTNALLPSLSSAGTNAVQAKMAYAKYVSGKIRQLDIMAMKGDPYSLNTILSEMKNTNKVIRHAALEAAIQSSDRSIIPQLKEIADQTEDPREKVEILDAIEFIKLPSLTERLAERRAKGIEPGTNRLRRATTTKPAKTPAEQPAASPQTPTPPQ